MTFGNPAGDSFNLLGDGTTYSEAGLTFTSSVSGQLATWQSASLYNAAGNGVLWQEYGAQTVTATLTGGGSFLLNSIDLADLYNAPASGRIALSWTTTSGSGSQSLMLDSAKGLQTFTLNLADVTSFTLEQGGPYFQLDNVNFSIAAVPEPSTWMMMLLGVGGIGMALRRRRSAGMRFVPAQG